jgi:hypothetical protein
MNQSVVVAVIVVVAAFYLGRMGLSRLRAMTSKKAGGCGGCGCSKGGEVDKT